LCCGFDGPDSEQILHASNADLSDFNRISTERFAALADRFGRHVGTLHAVHTSLLDIFRRTRALRSRLIAAHPELAAAAAAADAAREAEIEQVRCDRDAGNAAVDATATEGETPSAASLIIDSERCRQLQEKANPGSGDAIEHGANFETQAIRRRDSRDETRVESADGNS
jgi:hypothetical protein